MKRAHGHSDCAVEVLVDSGCGEHLLPALQKVVDSSGGRVIPNLQIRYGFEGGFEIHKVAEMLSRRIKNFGLGRFGVIEEQGYTRLGNLR